MKSLKNKLFIGLTVVAMTAAGSVFAQAASPEAPAAGMHGSAGPGMHGPRGDDHAKMYEKMQDRMVKQRAQLYVKMKITPEQEPAWKAFVEASAPGPMPARLDRKKVDAMTTPERMETMLEHAKVRQVKMQEQLTALKTFYAVLTPEQQKIFDDSHRTMGHKGKRQHHGKQHGPDQSKMAK